MEGNTTSPPASPEEILTVQQVAERLQLRPSWVYTHADELGAYRTGKYIRFRWQRVLERLERAPSEITDEQPSAPLTGRRTA